jgi:hypothetical protein
VLKFSDRSCRVRLDDVPSHEPIEKHLDCGKMHRHARGGLPENEKVNIYPETWSSVNDQSKWRYNFFREKLEIQVTSADVLELLRLKYPQYPPGQQIERWTRSRNLAPPHI